MRGLCIYHANCADGFAAATVVHSLYGDSIEFVAANYGDEPPDCTGKYVVITDFSFKRDVMKRIIEQAEFVEVIDHHESAQRELEGLEAEYQDKCKVTFDMNRSGAGLTWDICYPGRKRPLLIDTVEDRDLWRFKLPNTKEITAALFSYEMDFVLWGKFLAEDDTVSSLAAEGRALLRKHRKDVESLAKNAFMMKIGEYEVPTVNANHIFASDLGNLLCVGHPFAAVFTIVENEAGMEMRVSLRSDKTTGINVAEIAEKAGGGGHRNAARFSVDVEINQLSS